MRIAQVAPLYESVPPRFYGGTERVVANLTEGLMDRGHEVTLFASGDSCTSAELVACCSTALRLEGRCHDPLIPHLLMLEEVIRRADRFDVVHFHCDYLSFSAGRRMTTTPSVTTLHGRLDLPDLRLMVREFSGAPLVSISDAQRAPLPGANWLGTVHHGLPVDLLPFHPGPGEYLAFLGRVSPEKRVDRAIRLAREVGVPLRIAAKVDVADREYYENVVRPLLDDPLVEFVGEVGEVEKAEFLGRALAMVFLIDWPEPFGLAVIESLACGTPVIAARRGSVPEILDDGQTGFVVDSMSQATEAVRRLPEVSRGRCREVFERRFSVERMVDDYLELYRQLMVARAPIFSVA